MAAARSVLTVRVAPELYERLRQLAFRRRQSINALAIDLLLFALAELDR